MLPVLGWAREASATEYEILDLSPHQQGALVDAAAGYGFATGFNDAGQLAVTWQDVIVSGRFVAWQYRPHLERWEARSATVDAISWVLVDDDCALNLPRTCFDGMREYVTAGIAPNGDIAGTWNGRAFRWPVNDPARTLLAFAPAAGSPEPRSTGLWVTAGGELVSRGWEAFGTRTWVEADPPGPGNRAASTGGGYPSRIVGAADDGRVVLETAAGHVRVWDPRDDTTRAIDDPGTATAVAVNAVGQVIGTMALPGGTEFGFVWDEVTGTVPLGPGVRPVAINAAGQVLAERSPRPGTEEHVLLFDLETGRAVELGSLSGGVTWSTALGEDGSVVGRTTTASGRVVPFYWRADLGMIELGQTDGSYGLVFEPRAVNARGEVVGLTGHPDDGYHVAVYDVFAGTLTDLGVTPWLGYQSPPYTGGPAELKFWINEAGEVAGHYPSAPDPQLPAFGGSSGSVRVHPFIARPVASGGTSIALSPVFAPDACPDADADGVCTTGDVCPHRADPDQADADADGVGDACDLDPDGDGVAHPRDACPFAPAVEPDLVGDGCPDTMCDLVVHLHQQPPSRLADAVRASVRSPAVAACAADTRGDLASAQRWGELTVRAAEDLVGRGVDPGLADDLRRFADATWGPDDLDGDGFAGGDQCPTDHGPRPDLGADGCPDAPCDLLGTLLSAPPSDLGSPARVPMLGRATRACDAEVHGRPVAAAGWARAVADLADASRGVGVSDALADRLVAAADAAGW